MLQHPCWNAYMHTTIFLMYIAPTYKMEQTSQMYYEGGELRNKDY